VRAASSSSSTATWQGQEVRVCNRAMVMIDGGGAGIMLLLLLLEHGCGDTDDGSRVWTGLVFVCVWWSMIWLVAYEVFGIRFVVNRFCDQDFFSCDQFFFSGNGGFSMIWNSCEGGFVLYFC
jgi:hypothetical protein